MQNFNFNTVGFPLIPSENVRRYFYPEFMYSYPKSNPDETIKYELFCDILDGKDRSQNAVMVLERLLDPRYDRLPPKSFDIINDNIEEHTAFFVDTGQKQITHEIHRGVCVLDNLFFDFEYTVNFHNSYYIEKDGTKNGRKIIRYGSTVKLQGDSKEVGDKYMHKACQYYFLYKSYNFDEDLIKKAKDDEYHKFFLFREEHKKEFSDYLNSLSWNCSKVNWRIKAGFVLYDELRNLERGHCRFGSCPNNCLIKEYENEYGEHDDFWFEIGLDKLGFKFLK